MMTAIQAPTRLHAVLMGDRAHEIDHGSHQTVANWMTGLERVGIVPLVRLPGTAWREEPTVRVGLEQGDLVVVLGHDTFSRDVSAMERVVAAAEYAAKFGVPSYMINGVWRLDSADLAQRMRVFQKVFVRDRTSQRILARYGTDAQLTPDLLFATDWTPGAHPREGWLIGDAAEPSLTQALYRLSRELPHARFVPSTSGAWRDHDRSVTRRLRALTASLLGWSGLVPAASLGLVMGKPDVASYMDQLSRAAAVLTGQYATVCLAMVTRTPFLAVTTDHNEWAELLAEAGLRTDRLLTSDELRAGRLQAALATVAYTTEEAQRLEEFLGQAREAVTQMFELIGHDAEQHVRGE